MVVAKAVQAGCSACRVSLLRTFTSLPLAASSLQYTTRSLGRLPLQQSRRVSQQSDANHEVAVGTSKEIDSNPQTDVAEDVQPSQTANYAPVEAIPWYLQEDAPKTEVRALSDRQKIPELPESPPAILQPLLQQISIDLGLDDLTLLDLRHLDPPPALGANLIMLIGTTRSERHLHVSADRLCRWLRTNYRLRPDADGLIGRNELKLKLKRKAKRAKLMGSASNDSYDDGVRTGWVCVDVGVVESGKETEEAEQPEGFVGFGRRTEGVRIVVQMMTEEKRLEVNLEKLWGDVLKRGGKMDIDAEFGEARLGVADSLRRNVAAPKIRVTSGQWEDTKSPIVSHVRRFHSARRLQTDTMKEVLMQDPSFDVHRRYDFGVLEGIQRTIQTHLASAEFQQARDSSSAYLEEELHLSKVESSRIYLHNLSLYLESLPMEQARQEVGNGLQGHASTPFMQAFQEAVTRFPNQAQVEAKIWLYCWAHKHEVEGYDIPTIYGVLKEAYLAGTPLSTATYLNVIQQLFSTQDSISHIGPDQKSLRLAGKIIKTMEEQGHILFAPEVLVGLQKALATGLRDDVPKSQIYTDAVDTFNLPSLPMSPIQKRIHLLIMHLKMPLMGEEHRLALMEMYAQQQNWVEFWDIWRLAPRLGKPRSAQFYANMFILVAATHHINGVQTVLRNWTPEMAKEDPPVIMENDVGLAIGYCLQVADPNIEQAYEEDPNSPAEWVRLRKRLGRAAGSIE